MKRFSLCALATLAMFQAAQADTIFYNATKQKVRVDVTLPNGEVKSSNVDPGSSTASSTHFIYDYRVAKVNYEVFDEMGTSLGKGPTEAKNSAFAVLETAGGSKVFPVGHYSGNGSLPAAVVANFTGEAGTFDFVGESGLDGQRGVALPTGFDTKKPFRFNKGESRYSVKFNGASGAHQLEQKLESGRYYAIYHGPNGKVVMSYFGYIK